MLLNIFSELSDSLFLTDVILFSFQPQLHEYNAAQYHVLQFLTSSQSSRSATVIPRNRDKNSNGRSKNIWKNIIAVTVKTHTQQQGCERVGPSVELMQGGSERSAIQCAPRAIRRIRRRPQSLQFVLGKTFFEAQIVPDSSW